MTPTLRSRLHLFLLLPLPLLRLRLRLRLQLAAPVIAAAFLSGAAAAATRLPTAPADFDGEPCRQALAQLRSAEEVALAGAASAATLAGTGGQRPVASALDQARRRAGLACLVGPQASASAAAQWPRPRAPSPAPPVAVPSTLASPRSRPPPPAMTAAPTPAAASPRLTSCDPGGCWAADGTRLRRVAPNVVEGPRGLCMLQGPLLRCAP